MMVQEFATSIHVARLNDGVLLRPDTEQPITVDRKYPSGYPHTAAAPTVTAQGLHSEFAV